jgi:hypothetical protein
VSRNQIAAKILRKFVPIILSESSMKARICNDGITARAKIEIEKTTQSSWRLRKFISFKESERTIHGITLEETLGYMNEDPRL